MQPCNAVHIKIGTHHCGVRVRSDGVVIANTLERVVGMRLFDTYIEIYRCVGPCMHPELAYEAEAAPRYVTNETFECIRELQADCFVRVSNVSDLEVLRLHNSAKMHITNVDAICVPRLREIDTPSAYKIRVQGAPRLERVCILAHIAVRVQLSKVSPKCRVEGEKFTNLLGLSLDGPIARLPLNTSIGCSANKQTKELYNKVRGDMKRRAKDFETLAMWWRDMAGCVNGKFKYADLVSKVASFIA